MKPEGGMTDRICYVFRLILHLYMLCMTVYLIIVTIVMYYIRVRQSYPGESTWLAKKISAMPYGALFFEEGEFFDCAICLEGIWKGQSVCRLTCNQEDRHVFHTDCLRSQVANHNNQYCVLCHQPILVSEPPVPEVTEE